MLTFVVAYFSWEKKFAGVYIDPDLTPAIGADERAMSFRLPAKEVSNVFLSNIK